MKGPDGKELLSMEELEKLMAKYKESGLDMSVILHVSECQQAFFLHPEAQQIFNIKPGWQEEGE
jgi:GAF domain-containing protein